MPSRHFAKCLENRAPPMRSPSPPPRAAHFTRRPPKIRPSIQPPHGKPRNASRWGWCGSRLVWCVRWWFSVVGGLGRGLRGGCAVLPVCVGGCVGLRGFLRVKKSALSYKAWRQSRHNQLLAPVIPKTHFTSSASMTLLRMRTLSASLTDLTSSADLPAFAR